MQDVSILLVDDNGHQHELFDCYAMMHEDIALHHASTLEEALAVIEKSEPDILLLDNQLTPYGDFRKTVPEIRASGFDGRLILISADIDYSQMDAARDLSVDRWIDKFEFNLSNFKEKVYELRA